MKIRNIILLFAPILLVTAFTQKPAADQRKVLVGSLKIVTITAWGSGEIFKVMSLYANDAIMISGQKKKASLSNNLFLSLL